ncbi:hypothetical protein AC25_2974 [Escherichia coli 1-110-08_S3_C2]|nr:hypothetical protein AC55_3034 [Escherichia coli 1-110-08_S3_C3]EYE21904.1 hypothetical protein AC25_2974 [Escherichia coli 1-110-08_S3_C2]
MVSPSIFFALPPGYQKESNNGEIHFNNRELMIEIQNK